MSVPEKPITRKDMFYDGILTGNTVPEPITREEMYLYAIAKKDAQGGNSADLSNYYTKTETNQQITTQVAEIVANAPEDFDTLKEISDWITGHEDSAAAMNSAIVTNTNALNDKVDKVTGKQLSTNDFTNADKSKLDGLPQIVKLDSMADFENITEKTADFYFIKEG